MASGLRWKKARVALTSHDPDYRAKVDAIKSVLAFLPNDEAFFSIDELGPIGWRRCAEGELFSALT